MELRENDVTPMVRAVTYTKLSDRLMDPLHSKSLSTASRSMHCAVLQERCVHESQLLVMTQSIRSARYSKLKCGSDVTNSEIS